MYSRLGKEDVFQNLKEYFSNTEGDCGLPHALDSLNFLCVDSHLRIKMRRDGEGLVNILEKVVKTYNHCEDTKDYFILNSVQKNLITIESNIRSHLRFGRLNGMFCAGTGGYKVVSTNFVNPKGLLFSSRLMNFISSTDSFHTIMGCRQLNDPLQNSLAFFMEILSCYQAFSGPISSWPNIAILYAEGEENSEVREIFKYLSRLGVSLIVADPRELEYEKGILRRNQFPIDLVWNHIGYHEFDEVLDSKIEDTLIQAYKDKAVCCISSFASRYLIDNPFCLAYLHSGIFQRILDENERELVSHLVPWSHKLVDGPVNFRGRNYLLQEVALTHKDSLVLKWRCHRSKDHVILGKTLSPSKWRKLIRSAWNKHAILQEYIPPLQLPLRIIGEGDYKLTETAFNLYLLGGNFQGYSAAANGSLESTKLAVFSHEKEVLGPKVLG